MSIFFLGSTVFLFSFVVDCGLVTRLRESSYRPSEYLMHLRDEHNAQPHYRWRERGGEQRRVSNLQPPSLACLLSCEFSVF